MSHVLDFKVNELEVGTQSDPEASPSRLDLQQRQSVTVSFQAAALLQPEPSEETERIRGLRLDQKPYWHIERCRIGNSRKVPVEVVVNGEVDSTHELVADGELRSFTIPVDVQESSWIAVRILPSVHTNPVFVHVDGKPIRANSRSAQWCIDAVQTCWESKREMIRPEEREVAKEAYEAAKEIYRGILAESE